MLNLQIFLRANDVNLSGNKSVLVAKCYDLINQHSAVKDDHLSGVDSGKLIDSNPLSALKDKQSPTMIFI